MSNLSKLSVGHIARGGGAWRLGLEPLALYKMAGEMIDKQLFDCVKLLEVQESSPVAGGETPFNSIGMSVCKEKKKQNK